MNKCKCGNYCSYDNLTCNECLEDRNLDDDDMDMDEESCHNCDDKCLGCEPYHFEDDETKVYNDLNETE